MSYTLVTATGQVFQFYIKQCADCYQQAFGGVVFTQQILETADQPA